MPSELKRTGNLQLHQGPKTAARNAEQQQNQQQQWRHNIAATVAAGRVTATAAAEGAAATAGTTAATGTAATAAADRQSCLVEFNKL